MVNEYSEIKYIVKSSRSTVCERNVDCCSDTIPVMLFVHGGGFSAGSSRGLDKFATFGNVVGVSVNYRLGTLGFISTNDDAATGNYGLFDLHAALKWVSENIAYFGGDPERITLMGSSAGSVLVSHLLLSTFSNHYFQRAICVSGSANSYWGVTDLHQEKATRSLGLAFGCNILNNDAMMKCLREKDASRLAVLGFWAPVVLNLALPTFIPVVDGILTTDQPRVLIEAGYSSGHDIMFGNTYHDSAAFTHYGFISLADTALIRNLTVMVVLGMYENGNELANLAMKQYPGILDEDLETRRRALVRFGTDWLFTSAAQFEVGIHSKYVLLSIHFFRICTLPLDII